MSLKTRIEEDFRQAVRQKSVNRIDSLRMAKAAIQNKEIEKRGECSEAEIQQILRTLVKQRRESIELFQKGGRSDLVAKETEEMELLESYLPQPLSDAELEQLIVQTVQELGAAGPKDLGKVMQAVMTKLQGRADGKTVNAKVKAILNKAA